MGQAQNHSCTFLGYSFFLRGIYILFLFYAMLFSLFEAISTLDLRLYSLLGLCLCPGLLAGGAPLTIQCWPANTIVNYLYSTLYLYLYLSLYLCWTLSLPAPSLLLLAIQCWPANGTVINLAQPEQQERGGANFLKDSFISKRLLEVLSDVF